MTTASEKEANAVIERLIRKGFKEYSRSRFDSPYVKRAFQKRILDDEGNRKYFVDVLMYEAIRDPRANKSWGPNFELRAQLYKKGSHKPIDLLFHASWDEDSVEQFINRMFEAGLLENYDTGDEDA